MPSIRSIRASGSTEFLYVVTFLALIALVIGFIAACTLDALGTVAGWTTTPWSCGGLQ